MTEVGFYHLHNTSLDAALPKLLEKALTGGFRVLVHTPDEIEAERLAVLLWRYDPDGFMPHGTAKDGHEAEQPIFLTAGRRNPNAADMLIQTGGADWRELAGFSRVLDLFDGRDEAALAAARERWRSYKQAGYLVTYFQQRATGGWERRA